MPDAKLPRFAFTFTCRRAGAIGWPSSVYSKALNAASREEAEDAARLSGYEAGYEHLHLISWEQVT